VWHRAARRTGAQWHATRVCLFGVDFCDLHHVPVVPPTVLADVVVHRVIKRLAVGVCAAILVLVLALAKLSQKKPATNAFRHTFLCRIVYDRVMRYHSKPCVIAWNLPPLNPRRHHRLPACASVGVCSGCNTTMATGASPMAAPNLSPQPARSERDAAANLPFSPSSPHASENENGGAPEQPTQKNNAHKPGEDVAMRARQRRHPVADTDPSRTLSLRLIIPRRLRVQSFLGPRQNRLPRQTSKQRQQHKTTKRILMVRRSATTVLYVATDLGLRSLRGSIDSHPLVFLVFIHQLVRTG